MCTNKEIVTEIIDSLDLNFNKRMKVTKESLIECWSEHRKEPDYKYFNYTSTTSMARTYKSIFKSINKNTRESWKLYILRVHCYKYCPNCKVLCKLEDFSAHKNTVSGVQGECKVCSAQYNLKYHTDNAEKIKERHAKYKKEHKDGVNALNAKRRASKLNRTPMWQTEKDLQGIKALYTKAIELEKLQGIKYHVDHIIPLQGELVSGLHVPQNLQVITAKENLSKNNRYNV